MSEIAKFVAASGYDTSELIDKQTSTREKILSSEIPWQNLVQLGIIQEKENFLIKKYDKRSLDTKKALIQQVNLKMNIKSYDN